MSPHPPSDLHPTADDDARSQRVADDLKLGFQALAGQAVPDDGKPDWHRRLIAITNAAKHDLPTAERRLERYWADWEAAIGPRPTIDRG